MDIQLKRWENMYDLYPDIIIQNLRYKIHLKCSSLPPANLIPPSISYTVLKQMYPDENSNLYSLFTRDIDEWSITLIQHYNCHDLQNDINNLPYFIHELFLFQRDFLTTGGGKFTYKGRKYVIRNGLRSGKYILVKNKKVYLSQL